MANPLEQALNRVKQILSPTASSAMSAAKQGYSNLKGNLKALSNSETRKLWTSADAPVSNAIRTFSEPAQQMGRGVGGVIRSPFDFYFNSKNAQIDQRLQNTLRNQQAGFMKSGDLASARDRAGKIANIGQQTANRQIGMGQQLQSDRNDAALGTVRTGIQLLGAKGLDPKSLLSTMALSGGIGYGATRLMGGSNQQALNNMGSSLGDALAYRGINKVSDKLFANPIMSRVAPGNMGARVGFGAGVNALANLGEDEVLAKVGGKKITNTDRAISLATGAAMGGISQAVQTKQYLRQVEKERNKLIGAIEKAVKENRSSKELQDSFNKFTSNYDEPISKLKRKIGVQTSAVIKRIVGTVESTGKVAEADMKDLYKMWSDHSGSPKLATYMTPEEIAQDLWRHGRKTYSQGGFAGEIDDASYKPDQNVKVKQQNLTQQVAENVTGKKLRVRPSPTVEAPPIKALTEPEVVKSNNRAKEAGVPSREEIKASLPKKLDNFVQETLGYTTEAPTGGTRQANLYTRTLRSGQAKLTSAVEKGLGSDNPLIRNATSTMQNFFRGLGMSPDRAAQSAELRGGLATSVQRGSDVADSLYATLGKDPKVIANSRTRINAVLDPEISKIKVKLSDLTPDELAVHNLIRKGLDYVHDVNYANGFISEKTYKNNLGTYTPRKYVTYEMPEEVNKFAQQTRKIDLSSSKARKALDDWKIENSANDPVYALGTALTQTETNSAIKKYTDFLAGQPNLISDVERPGFTKLSDSKAYGALSGKYVLNSAAEDLKGFFYSNDALQKTYDVFRAWDRLPPRQIQKKLLTVFNPTTNVGNIISDQIFGWGTGVDPLTLNKNLYEIKTNPKVYKQLSDYLMRKGIVGTDITRTDIVSKFSSIDSVARSVEQPKSKFNTLKKVGNKVQSFYGGTDDAYKVAALKSLLDKGFSLEEATRKVADGFQNYASVGKFYDTWAKTPVIGSPFIKFQGDLIRIIKNTVVNNPLGLISFLGTLQAVSYLSSKASGETPEDYKTRTERFAAPMIPGLNIPLTWQTPIGEINAARYISPFYANNETTNVAKMIPFAPNINTKKDVATNIAMNANDPLVSPLIQTLVNRDFRGKPISDPNETKWSPSTLTGGEKLANQAKFITRAYTPPPVNSAIDVGSAMQGKPNMYGATQTPGQALARLGGIKISQFGPEQAQTQRTNDAYYDQKKLESNAGLEKTIAKDLLSGKIDQKTADARIANIYKDSGSATKPLSEGITQLQDGTYATMIGKQLKSFDTPEEATLAVDKQKFKESDKNIYLVGDTVFRRSKDGDVTTMPKIDYDTLVTTQKMENAKLSDDYKTWMDLALVQASNIQTQMQDPTLDDLEKGDLQQKLDALIESAIKYQGYGGFKKPKKAKALPKMQVAKFTRPSFKMKRDTAKSGKIQTVASKKIAPPKVKVSRFKVKKA